MKKFNLSSLGATLMGRIKKERKALQHHLSPQGPVLMTLRVVSYVSLKTAAWAVAALWRAEARAMAKTLAK